MDGDLRVIGCGCHGRVGIESHGARLERRERTSGECGPQQEVAREEARRVDARRYYVAERREGNRSRRARRPS